MKRTTKFLAALLIAISGFAYQISAQTISTIAGTGTAAESGDGGSALSADINAVPGIASDAAGNVYICDNTSHVVRKINTSGIIFIVAGTSGSSGFSGDGGAATNAQLNQPSGVAVDAAGNLYIADFGNNVVRKVTASGTISTYAGNYAAGAGYGGDGGLATSALLNQPISVALDPSTNLYILDQGNYRIRKVTPAGVISTYGGNGTSGSTGDGGAAIAASFNLATNIAADGGGNLYIADPNSGKVRKINVSGIISTFAGTGGTSYSGDGGAASAAVLYLPTGVSVDNGGNVYISDEFNNRIRKVNTSGIISTFAGNGTGSFAGDGGAATAAEINLPTGTASDAAGNLYIADNFNYRIRKVTPSCSGTPTAGVATSTATTVSFAGTLFTLSLSGATSTTGLTYQWQQSADGTTYTNISGATYVPYVTSETANTYYRCIVTCASSSNTSGAAYVSFVSSYCTPSFSYPYCSTSGECAGISKFAVNGISGTSILDNGACSGSGYQDHSSLSATFRQGGSYIATIAGVSACSAPSPGLGNQVWIDFNDDNTFATSESIGYYSLYSGVAATGHDTLSIPVTANLGTHRMRVVQIYNGAANYPPTAMMDACTPGYYYGEARDYTIVIAPLPACSGTPAAGTAVSTISTACASAAFTLSLSGATDTVSLLTYQWQSSPDGSTWTNVSGAEYSTLTTTESANTYYRCLVTCSVGGSTSTSANVLVNYIGACYCTPNFLYAATSCSTYDFAIGKFYINGEAGTSIADVAGCSGSGYLDRTSLSCNLMQSISYVTTVVSSTGTSSLTDGDQIWIDFNDNGTFESSESVGGNAGYTGTTATGYATITIPLTAPVGNHRLRVVQTYASYVTYPGISACPNSVYPYYYGDSRDYSVNIVALPPCSGAPAAGTVAANLATACPSDTFQLATSGGTIASSINFQWQASSDSVTWHNLSGATSNTLTASESASTFFRVYIVCTISGLADTSAGHKVPFVGYCYCTPSFNYAPCGETWALGKFLVNGQSSTSIMDSSACTSAGYENLTGLSCTMVQGLSYVATVVTSNGTTSGYSESNQIWIDFNDNGTFESSESITGKASYTGNPASVLDTIAIPSGTATGTHRLRLIQTYSAYVAYPSISACPNGAYPYYYGEARDYDVNIISPTPAITGSPTTHNFGSVNVGSCSSPTAFTISGVFLTPASGTLTVTATAPFSVSSSISGTYTTSYTIAYTGGTLASTPVYVKFCPTASGGSSASVCISGGGLSSSYCMGVLGTGVGSCNIITTIAGIGTGGFSGDGSAATAAKVKNPAGLIVDASGNVYFADNSNHCVRKINTSGIISTYAGVGGSGGFTGDGGAATAEQLQGPEDVAFDAAGNLYISDALNERVRKVTPAGIMTTVAGTGGSGYSGDGGQATAAYLHTPYGLTVDRFGNLYITETGNHTVRKVNPSGVISTIAGTGTLGFSGDGSAATGAALDLPTAVKVDGAGNVFIADRNNQRIRKINTSGIISTYAGNGTGGSTGDGGQATAAELFRPTGIALDGSGNLYIADQDNNKIRLVNTSGNISTYAGNGTGGFLGDGGPATAAELNYAGGVAIDNANNIYIGDGTSNRLRKVTSGDLSVAAISGPTSVIVGNNITLTDASSGGTWTSSSTSIATVSSGSVHGVAVGTVFITYSLTNSCGTVAATYPDTVNSGVCSGTPSTGSISATLTTACSLPFSTTITATGISSGLGYVYQWQSSTDSTTWSDVTGATNSTYTASVTTSTIYYRFKTTCTGSGSIATTAGVKMYQTFVPTVASITGSLTACLGSTTSLADVTTGGVWSCSTPSYATIDASGVVHSISVGAASISYTVTNFCGSGYASTIVNVDSVTTVGAITGPTSVCVSRTISLNDGVAGGTWTVSSGTIATINSSGVMTGYSAGVDTAIYTISGSCGSSRATYVITVQPLPSAGTISGTTSVCPAGTSTLTDGIIGGSWSSANNLIATVSSTGVVTGVATGTTRISYSYTNSCGTAQNNVAFTVNPLPSHGTITGASSTCIGDSTTYVDTASGGSWSSSNPSIASVGLTTGEVYGRASGTARITYTVSNTCGTADTFATITVNTAPSAGTITGTTSFCQGATSSFTDGVTGGTWSSDSTAVATVNSSGLVTGTGPGTSLISYTVSGSCGSASATIRVTVRPLPAAGAITGASSVCTGLTTPLTDTALGGTWSSSNTAKATISATGVVTGIAAGTITISYTVINSCGTASATMPFTILASPNAGSISGSPTVCIGSTTNLAETVTGGTWSSSDTTIARIGLSGIVTGVAAGTAIISYSVTNSCGTSVATDTMRSSLAPTAGTITGVTAFCQGATSTLLDAVSGGAWSSSNTAIATVNATGTVLGVSGGNATISYTITGSCGSVSATKLVLITGAPNAGLITGTLAVCAGGTTALADTAAGGTWTCTTSSLATVSPTGVVHGIAVGTAVVSYSVSNVCGTAVTSTNVAVQSAAVAGAITGTTHICAGAASLLSDTVAGGVWTSADTTKATINSTGIMNGIAGGSTTITYSVTNSCGTVFTTTAVTIDPAPTAGTITGSTAVCPGSTITLNDLTTGGTWSSSDVTKATVGTTGIVTGVATGTVTISYSVTNLCGTVSALDTITVSPLPNAGTITGVSSICTGNTSALTDVVSGGTWTSSALAIATVNASGLVTGVTAGTANITYTVTNSCGTADTFLAVVVNTTPSAGTISGVTSVCPGSSSTLVDGVTGGTWSSSNTTIATINATGTVHGVTAGTVTISYIISSGCGVGVAHVSFTVSTSTPAGVISGSSALCLGSSTGLSETVSGGTWSSSNTSIATINAAGSVRGVAAGSATISYAVSGTCGTGYATFPVTVTTSPTAGTISGPAVVCQGSNISLTDSISGGTWTSSDTTKAMVSSTGVVTGIATGSADITYTTTFSCGTATAVHAVTVNPLPMVGAITGTTTICTGSSVTLSNTTSGGTWSSASTSIATVNASGSVLGVSTGSTTITYSYTNSCGTADTTTGVTIVAGSSAGTITGSPTTFCQGTTTHLSDTTSGGTWSSSNTSVATVGSTGIVTGVAGGSAVISYTISSSCGSATTTIAVAINPLPSVGAISGASTVCVGGTTSLTDTATGGSWSSSNNTIAGVSSTGVVTGVAAGTVTISYSGFNSCGVRVATHSITVSSSATAGAITGTTAICLSATSTLTDSISGGTWSSSNTSVATVSSTGTVSGVSAGSAIISYSVSSSCGSAVATIPVTITSGVTAGSISGSSSVCAGSTLSLSDAVTGGTWSSSNTTIATVDASGTVSALIGGSVTISYTVTSSCGTANALKTVTVNALPNAGTIGGGSTMCSGTTMTLTETATGGTWTSSNISVASINASGLVAGLSAGTTIISYTVTSTCGTASATDTIMVNAAPSAGFISGVTTVCAGATTTLTDATTGGTWSSSSTAVASVDASGNVTGVASGTATITYTVTNTCGSANATTTVTVGATASAGTITGASTVCQGATTTLTDGVSGGTWISSNATIAAVSASGVVTGVSAGTVTISYVLSTSCGTAIAVANVTVNPLPDAGTISGVTSICTGTATTLSETVSGGTWSSSNASVAMVSSTGSVTGVASGTATISYTVTNSCGSSVATTSVVVNTSATAGTITGTTSLCPGTTSALSDAVTGGTWSSSNVAIATVSSIGVVTAVSAGTVTISYAVSTSCGTAIAMATVTVGSGVSAGTISGASSICLGSSATLTDAVTGGTWSSSNTAVATVSTTGVVTSVAAGSVVISYSVSGSGCGGLATYNVVVGNGSLPAAAVTPASATLCGGSPVNLTIVTSGTAISYQWYMNGTLISGATNGHFTATAAGFYNAEISNGCITDTLNTVHVLAAPTPVISAAGTHTLTTGTYAHYQWYLNGTAIAGATNQTYSYTANGTYTVKVTDVNGCAATSAGHVVSTGGGGTGVAQVNNADDISIYPNPATSLIHISASVKVNVVILSSVGTEVVNVKDASEISMSGLSNGLYIIMVYDENNAILKVSKLVKAE